MISPTLLEVNRDGTTLHLRIDDLTLEEETLTADTITTWTLYECDDVERIFDLFTDALGKPVYIETYPEETDTTVAVWANYAADEETFTCGSAQQVSTSASFVDLQQRVMRLASLYRAGNQEHNTFYRRITYATQQLQKEIEKASDRCIRKASFFQNTRPDKAAVYITQHDIYDRVLQLFHTIIDDAYRDQIKDDDQSGTI
jgi:hypothetical protein